jgi:predicted MFS family arabinose efflux permease
MFQNLDDRKDPMDGEYIGNIWGWKFSFIGLALLILLLGLMIYRHYSLGVPIGYPEEEAQQEELLQIPNPHDQ